MDSIRRQRYFASSCQPIRARPARPFSGESPTTETSAAPHDSAISYVRLKPEKPKPKPKLDEAQSEVYNLCARLRLVPTFSLSVCKKWSPRLHKGLDAVRFDIAVPELEISVSNVSEDAAASGVAACNAFKAKFEHMVQSGSLPAKYQGRNMALTVETASAFVRFCRQTKSRPPFLNWSPKCDHKAIPGFVNATVFVGGGANKQMTIVASWAAVPEFAKLVTAVWYAKMDPGSVTRFHQDLKRRARMWPIPLHLPSGVVGIMESVTQPALDQDLNLDGSVAISASTAIDGRLFGRHPLPSGPSKDGFKRSLQRRLWHFETAPEFEKMRTHLASLPMSQHREQVLSLVRDGRNPFSIVVGATGSGKTTQVPQILLDDAIKCGDGADCNILCTQPRRIAATSVAARVAAERGERLGESVGYHVRFDAKLPRPHGSITFCTTGILLAQITADADGILNYASHIVVDEVHERDLPTDFLIAMLKKSIKSRQKRGLPVPKVVLMSATLDTELFSNYLGSKLAPAPSISVPGRTFPIQDRFLDQIMLDIYQSHPLDMETLLQKQPKEKRYLDQELGEKMDIADSIETNRPKGEPPSDQANNTDGTGRFGADISASERHEEFVPVQLVAAVVARIAETTEAGAILAFLPGLKEIMETERGLFDDIFNVGFRDKSKYRIYRLHSSVPREDQNAVFEDTPRSCRKIILSTNIAETSVTVPDVQHVVDAGKLRETRYDQVTGVGGLQCVWESKSNSRQRAGRAGRVRNGFYYALFSRDRYAQMAPTGRPELLRSDLQGACLAIKKQYSQQPVSDVLAGFIQPPPGPAVAVAVRQLKRLKALTKEEEITPLGRLLANLPVHPTLAKMIVMGVIFRCLDPMIIIGAASCETGLFVIPPGQRQDAKISHEEFGGHESDHLSMLQAFNELRTCRAEYGTELARDRAFTSFLRWNAFNSIRNSAQSILDILVRCGLAPAGKHDRFSELQYGPASLNANSKNHELIRGLLAAGLNPNLAAKSGGRRQFTSKDGASIVVHHSSQNAVSFTGKRFVDQQREAAVIAFSQLERTSGGGDMLWARDTTLVPPLTTLLFADNMLRPDEEGEEAVVILGDWLPFVVENAATTTDAAKAGGSVDGSRASSARHSLDVLLRFKSFLHTMLDRAYSNLSKLQRLHHEDEWVGAEEEEGEEYGPLSPQRSTARPATETQQPPVISLPDFVEDSLRTIATNAVVVVLDEMKKQLPVPKEDTTTSAAAIVTNRRPQRSTRVLIDRKPRDLATAV